MNETQDSIRCPQCFTENKLAVYLTVAATVRLPIVKGNPITDYEVLWERPIPGIESFLKFSSTNGQTRITVHKDEIEANIHCSVCNKVFRLDREFKCNVAK